MTEFKGKYDFLSNFYECTVEFEGITYQNSEAAFQAQKCLTEGEKQEFSNLGPSKAKRLGRRVTLRPGWDDIRLYVMYQVLKAKFDQHPDLKERLLATGDIELTEGNTWGDRYWGVDLETGIGENHLGKILMDLRKEYSSSH